MQQQRRRPSARHHRRTEQVYLRRRIAVFGGVPIVLGLIIYGFVAALASSPPHTPSRTHGTTGPRSVAATRHSTIGVRTFTFTDASRSTYNYTTGRIEKGRKIVVELRYPAKATAATTGANTANVPIVKRTAYPLIVFAPGYRLQPSDYSVLLDEWVRAGYLVASVEFPNTTYPASDLPYAAHLPHGSPETDLYLEPADLAYALGALKSSASTKSRWLDGLIDPAKIVLAGHSDGGSAVAALVYDGAYARDGLGVRGVAVLSGSEFPIANQSYGQPSTGAVPLLVIQSAADTCDAPSSAVQLYNAIGSPKYFDELATASHLGAVNGADAGAFSVVRHTTVAFFAKALGSRAVTDAQMLSTGTVKGVAALTTNSTLAPIPAPSSSTSCPYD